MGLQVIGDGTGKWPVYDAKKQTIIDIGGGPASILLKCINLGASVVIDPCPYPIWVKSRYFESGINLLQEPAEGVYDDKDSPVVVNRADEIWCYNCLQHTIDPGKIVFNMRKMGKVIRIFEWINTAITDGHPHSTTEEQLNEWFEAKGIVEEFKGENGCYGWAYYGVFPQ